MPDDAVEDVRFDGAARAAAQGWMRDFQAHCSKEPPNELFKLFKRDTTVRSVLCPTTLAPSNACSACCVHAELPSTRRCFWCAR